MNSHSTPAPTSPPQKEWFGHPPQLSWLFFTEMWERFGYYGMRAILLLYLTQHFLFRDNVGSGLYGAYTSLVYLTPLFGGLIADRYLGSKRSVKLGAVLMAMGYLGLCFGGDMAKPKLEYDGKTYAAAVERDGESLRKSVTMDGIKYAVEGRADGSVQLKAAEGSEGTDRTLEAGSFKFDGERDPFWVRIMFLSLSAVIVGNGFFKPNISTMVGSLYATGDARRDAGFTIFYMGIN
ncbi:MAG TPA: hypothetical protein VIY86_01990, partial [Pirellulaceae bacterium]